MKRSTPSLDQIFEAHLGTLALTLRPNSMTDYRCVAGRFLSWLHAAFPQARRSPNSAVIPICSAGSARCANDNRP